MLVLSMRPLLREEDPETRENQGGKKTSPMRLTPALIGVKKSTDATEYANRVPKMNDGPVEEDEKKRGVVTKDLTS